jgi:4-hydroxybutyryl-CoA dehydratase/vinylacetyl-CoA-Delta-isomerase
MDRRIFVMGERVHNPAEHPLIRPSFNACATTYELAAQPEHAGLMLATSSLTGKTVNRFTHLHQGTADLVVKVARRRGAENSSRT